MKIAAILKENITGHSLGEACYIVGFLDQFAACVFENGDIFGVYPFRLKITDPDYLDFDFSGKT